MRALSPVELAVGHDCHRHLTDSLSRMSKLQDAFDFRLGHQQTSAEYLVRGWRSCADFLSGGSEFSGWWDELSRWMLAEYGEAPERTVAAYVRNWYLQVPAYLAAMLFSGERRVPSLRPEDVEFRIAEDGRPHPDGIAVSARGFACLPDDPAAAADDATVVPTQQELVELLRARYVAHAREFVDAYKPTVRFGRRALWGSVTDALDIALWRAGKFGGNGAVGVADAAQVLHRQLAPFTAASKLRATIGEDGGLSWTRSKESCCYTYLLATGKGECSGCPRRPPRR